MEKLTSEFTVVSLKCTLFLLIMERVNLHYVFLISVCAYVHNKNGYGQFGVG